MPYNWSECWSSVKYHLDQSLLLFSFLSFLFFFLFECTGRTTWHGLPGRHEMSYFPSQIKIIMDCVGNYKVWIWTSRKCLFLTEKCTKAAELLINISNKLLWTFYVWMEKCHKVTMTTFFVFWPTISNTMLGNRNNLQMRWRFWLEKVISMMFKVVTYRS